MTEANTDVLQIICEQTHCDNDDFSALCENEAYKPYADSDQLESCCLCSEGIKIQNEFIEHLQNEHPNGKFQRKFWEQAYPSLYFLISIFRMVSRSRLQSFTML